MEAEDLNLGLDDHRLVVDVDEGKAEDDPEALDSDDSEEMHESASLGIETEGELYKHKTT